MPEGNSLQVTVSQLLELIQQASIQWLLTQCEIEAEVGVSGFCAWQNTLASQSTLAMAQMHSVQALRRPLAVYPT